MTLTFTSSPLRTPISSYTLRQSLRFPFDLVVDDVHAVEPETGDTLLAMERLKVELRFWKLFKKEIEIEEIEY